MTKPSLDSPASGEDTVPSSSLTFLASTHVQRSRNILREREAELLRTPPPHWGFPGSSEDKASACKAGDLGSIPGSGRSPGEGNGNPLQYSRLENPMDGGAWWATVPGIAKSWT